MRALVAAVAACFAVSVSAAPVGVLEHDGDTITLFDDRCELADKPESFANRAAMKAASGEVFRACFRLNGQMVELVYEDGDIGRIPVQAFKSPGKPA